MQSLYSKILKFIIVKKNLIINKYEKLFCQTNKQIYIYLHNN